MGWQIGYDENRERDIGYGVPAICDHPGCNEEIDRGRDYLCGGPTRKGKGCGLYFCDRHLVTLGNLCDRCRDEKEPYTPKPDALEWISWKFNHESWAQWRAENPAETAKLEQQISATAQMVEGSGKHGDR